MAAQPLFPNAVSEKGRVLSIQIVPVRDDFILFLFRQEARREKD
jgi:hypothetical protein